MDLIRNIFGIFFMLTWLSVDAPAMKLSGLLGLAVVSFRLYRQLRGIWDRIKQRHQEVPDWEPPKASVGRLCPYCGHPVEDGHKYCIECGNKLA